MVQDDRARARTRERETGWAVRCEFFGEKESGKMISKSVKRPREREDKISFLLPLIDLLSS